MPGHGERFVETFDDWFVRINKRVQRLERRLGRAGALSDSGWVTTGYTPGSGVTVSTFQIRKVGPWVQVRVVATIASISIPIHGDNTNTTLCVIPEEYRPEQIGSLTSSGVGRGAFGVVLASGAVQVSALVPSTTQTGSSVATNLQISLGGTYLVG